MFGEGIGPFRDAQRVTKPVGGNEVDIYHQYEFDKSSSETIIIHNEWIVTTGDGVQRDGHQIIESDSYISFCISIE